MHRHFSAFIRKRALTGRVPRLDGLFDVILRFLFQIIVPMILLFWEPLDKQREF